MTPAQLQTLLQTAITHHQAGRIEEAERIYRQVRAQAPRAFDAWHLGGVAALQRGRAVEAIELLAQAVRLDPRSGIAAMRLALAYHSSGRNEESVRQYQVALRLDPKAADTWANFATALRTLGKMDEAKEALAKAIALKPDFPEALDTLGALIADTQGLQHALPYFEKATQLNPKLGSAWCNLGLAQSHTRQYEAARSSLERAIALDPKAVKPLVARALVNQQTYRLQEAADDFAEAIRREPGNEEAHSGYLLTSHYLDDLSAEELARRHRAFGDAVRTAHPVTSAPPVTWDGQRPLRVAFLSPDLRRHAVAYFLLPLLEQVDRSRISLHLYHDHAVTDDMTAKLRAHAAVWRNFAGQSHFVVEKWIRTDAPDLLIDLSGHTGVNRLALFARRLAPVQITYLGYPNTTGLGEMDYRLTDAYVDPEGVSDRWHTEKLVRFAPTAWVFRPPAESPPATCPEGPRPFTFGCFNNFAKVSDRMMRVWSRILAAAPGSRLMLKGHELDRDGVKAGVLARLGAAGIPEARVVLAGRIANIADHLEVYRQIDVALDPFPYHGTTTTCEALWMGVPVVTLLGPGHASRVSGSLLTAAGHPEWISEDAESYVEIALGLHGQGVRGDAQRAKLRADLVQSPVMDEKAQAGRFWSALTACATRSL